MTHAMLYTQYQCECIYSTVLYTRLGDSNISRYSPVVVYSILGYGRMPIQVLNTVKCI